MKAVFTYIYRNLLIIRECAFLLFWRESGEREKIWMLLVDGRHAYRLYYCCRFFVLMSEVNTQSVIVSANLDDI